jgi:hypothetical protein
LTLADARSWATMTISTKSGDASTPSVPRQMCCSWGVSVARWRGSRGRPR